MPASADERAALSGLCESSSIEQNAEIVALLHRDAVRKSSHRAGYSDLVVANRRNGPIDTINVAFQIHYSGFALSGTGQMSDIRGAVSIYPNGMLADAAGDRRESLSDEASPLSEIDASSIGGVTALAVGSPVWRASVGVLYYPRSRVARSDLFFAG